MTEDRAFNGHARSKGRAQGGGTKLQHTIYIRDELALEAHPDAILSVPLWPNPFGCPAVGLWGSSQPATAHSDG